MPRCKNCKEKFEVKHFNQKYCFKSDCVKVWVETAKSQELEERKEATKRRIRNGAKLN